ncbi:hypothetical protein [Pontivivens ytuae]|uniref:Uncharacterized protein n=1 Tax=Pontivivens ytuae TaxID=2789856 RepID=A0A7S9QD88_9RHOB|nr:hypothetical protein [Pontivivens ytuae]QPH54127.1 hypothetical protein I0K15_20540 [Pontivivens ytuae]
MKTVERATPPPAPIDYRETRHFRLYQDFTVDPEAFIADALRDEDESLF